MPYVSSPIPSYHDVQISQAVKDINASYDALVDLFASFENFLDRLSIYTRADSTPALTNVLVKIITELLSMLALATKQVKQGRFSEFFPAGTTSDLIEYREFMKKIQGEKEIEIALQRLDRLAQDEARATAAQTLEVVNNLDLRRRVVVEGAQVLRFYPSRPWLVAQH